MAVLMASYEAHEEGVAEVEAGVAKMITAIEQEQPKRVRYALCKLPHGETFVGLLELEGGVDNPPPGIPAARQSEENLKNWVVGEPPAL